MALTWDPSRRAIVGWDANGDLWSFDGASFGLLADRTDPMGPGVWGGLRGQLAWDEAALRLTMLTDAGALLTCELDGQAPPAPIYTERLGASLGRTEAAFAFLPPFGRLVHSTRSGAVEWDGGAFVSVPAGGALPPSGGLYRSAWAFDEPRGVALLVSAIDRTQYPDYGCDGLNVWEYAVRAETPVAAARLVLPPSLAPATLTIRARASGEGQGLAGPVRGARLWARDPTTGRFTALGEVAGGALSPPEEQRFTLDVGALGRWQEPDGSVRLLVVPTGPATRAGASELALDALELVAEE